MALFKLWKVKNFYAPLYEMAQSTYRARFTPRNAILHLRRLGRKKFTLNLYKKNNPKIGHFWHKLGSVWNLGPKSDP